MTNARADIITSFPSTATVSVDILAMRAAIDYVTTNYTAAFHITSITSYANGAVRVAGTAYHIPGYPARLEVSAWGQANGDAGE